MLPIALAALLSLAAPAPADGAVATALRSGAPAGGQRAAAATAPLHGLPYAHDPLGEGGGPDPDPTIRLDAFDCMTLVETAVALGSAADLAEAARALDDVRHDGGRDLAHRLHEVLSQWLPANLRKGWIAPASRALAGEAAVAAATSYDARRWASLARAGLRLPGVPPAALPLGRFEVEVVPPDAALALAPRLPDGTLAFVVREERADRITRVTHAGLVFTRPDGARWVRHATSSLGVSRVIEEPLDRFLERQRKASARPITGLALFRILDNRARLAALPPP